MTCDLCHDDQFPGELVGHNLICIRCLPLMPQLLSTHDPEKCAGQFCCIHNPSNHHMREWPMVWRSDKGVMERICPHGCGHPDPDDAAYNERMGRGYLNMHGCDGCCNCPS